MKRRWSSALMAATLERLRPIGMGHAEAQRLRRAEDRDDRPAWPRKESAKCCTSRRDSDGRLPIGWCSPECERRPA